MEGFLRQEYGDDVFFITGMATVLHVDEEVVSVIKLFIEKNSIQEIIIASDTSCRFIKGFLKSENQFGSYAEMQIKNIMLDNNDTLSKTTSEAEKQKIIATSIVKKQAQEICRPNLLLSEILKNKINIKGIITTKSKNEIIELNLNCY